jgi:hypothetical protein
MDCAIDLRRHHSIEKSIVCSILGAPVDRTVIAVEE